MVGERALLASIAAVTLVAVVFIIESRDRDPAPPPVEPECPAPAAPVVKATPKAPAPTPSAPSVPTEPVPCAVMVDGHDTLELVADGESADVCWQNGACVDDHLGATTRPTPKPAVERAHLDGGRICTGTRCDTLGTHLRAAVRAGTIMATVDHGIVVVETGEVELWNRAADRRIPLPRPGSAPGTDGAVGGVEILGTRVLLVRAWDPNIIPPDGWWPSRGTIVDASGAVTGRVFVDPDPPESVVTDLGGDRFIVVNGSGGFTLIAHGTPTWFGDLAAWDASPAGEARGSDRAVWWGQHVPVTAVALDGEAPADTSTIDGTPNGKVEIARVAYKWCDYAACHVGRFDVDIHTDRRGHESQSLYRSSDHELPACTH